LFTVPPSLPLHQLVQLSVQVSARLLGGGRTAGDSSAFFQATGDTGAHDGATASDAQPPSASNINKVRIVLTRVA
jgi:hypothetical protein